MASKQPPHSAVLESQGSMRPVAVRARAFSQIEDSSTPTVIPNYMALTSMTTSPSSSAVPSSPPRSAKTLEIKGLVSPSRSPTRPSQAAIDRAKVAAKAVTAITSPVSKAANSVNTSASPNGAPISKGRDLFNSASPPAAVSSSTSPSPARSLRKTPSSLRATDTTGASRRASSQQWRDEAARLSQRVLELERENSQLRRMPSTTLPPRTVSHGERIETSFVSAGAGSGAVSLNGHETQGNATHSNNNNNNGGSNGDKEAIRTRMRKSNSVASGVGYTGLTVAEAVAASHRSRSKRTSSTNSMGVASASGRSHGGALGLAPLAPATQPLQKYKSGYWNERSNVKSSFSCNNLADMENRALAIDKTQLLEQQQQRPVFQLQKANSTNTKSNAKSYRDAAALMRSTTASSSSLRKNDSFQRSAMEPSGEEMAAQHKQQLAIAKSFHGTQVLASAQRKDRRKDLDIDELPSDSDSDSESDDGHMDDDKVHITSPRSYFEPSLRGMGGSFRLPNRSQSLAIGKRPTSSDVRLWVGSWNMGAADPFVDKSGIIDEQASAAMLQEFVPHGYHVYVLGLQEGVSENAYHAVAAYLNRNESGTRYYRLELKNSDSLVANKNHPGEATIDAVRGRGDGAFVGTKFTGLAVFYAAPVQDKIKLLRAGVHKFNLTSGSKGGVAAALMINQTSIVFVNCHLDARNDGYRREQIRNLNANLGKAMGHANFDLTEQFHHVVWMGDMNYRIVHLDPDIVLHMLEEGRNSELHDKFDGLLNDRRNGGVFDGFTEPNKFPDFYPTYKKFPKRGVVNYRSPSWTRLVYRVLYKEPFYKGGKVKKRVPGWCDRILIHSLLVSDSKLVPEKVLSPFEEDQRTWIDNYRSVNEGVGMDVSDHSPVYATFTLSFPQQSDALTNLSPRLTRRNSRSLSSVSTRGTQPRSTAGGSYFDNPNVVRRIAANVPNRPVSTVLRVFNMQLFWNDNVVVPKRTRVVAPLIGEDLKQCDVIGERCQGTNGLNLSLNAVVQHTRPLEHLHMLVWVKNETISGHCTLSLKRIARQDEGGEVKFRVPLYDNSMRLYYDGHPLVLVFSVRSKTFAK